MRLALLALAAVVLIGLALWGVFLIWLYWNDDGWWTFPRPEEKEQP